MSGRLRFLRTPSGAIGCGILVFVLLAGYILYTFIWSLLSQPSVRIDPVLYNVLASLSFFATPLIVAAVLMLFLRLFP